MESILRPFFWTMTSGEKHPQAVKHRGFLHLTYSHVPRVGWMLSWCMWLFFSVDFTQWLLSIQRNPWVLYQWVQCHFEYTYCFWKKNWWISTLEFWQTLLAFQDAKASRRKEADALPAVEDSNVSTSWMNWYHWYHWYHLTVVLGYECFFL